MAGPTLRVRKLRPGVQRGPTPSHAGHSRPIPSPSHQPVPAPASLRRGLEQPRTLSLGALPSLFQWLGGGEECPLRPLLGPWPGGCREALPCRDRQENAELSLVRREEGLVCEAVPGTGRSTHPANRRGEERKPGSRGGTGKKMLLQLWELSPPPPPRSPAPQPPWPPG